MGALKIAVTGANGFVGRACAEIAEARGHEVVRIQRDHVDLAQSPPPDLLEGVHAVIHTAAAMSNDPAVLKRDTETATRNLIGIAMKTDPQPLIVLASSIAVYDADLSGLVTEACQTETRLQKREPYVAAKWSQEEALRASGLQSWSLRIGAVYGPSRMWNANLGARIGPALLRFGAKGAVPIINIKDAAAALVRAAETHPNSPAEPLNIVENGLPNRKEYARAVHDGLILPLSWRLVFPIATLLEPFLGGKLPGLLRPRILKARFSPLSYSNEQAKMRLGWEPETHLRGGQP